MPSNGPFIGQVISEKRMASMHDPLNYSLSTDQQNSDPAIISGHPTFSLLWIKCSPFLKKKKIIIKTNKEELS